MNWFQRLLFNFKWRQMPDQSHRCFSWGHFVGKVAPRTGSDGFLFFVPKPGGGGLFGRRDYSEEAKEAVESRFMGNA